MFKHEDLTPLIQIYVAIIVPVTAAKARPKCG